MDTKLNRILLSALLGSMALAFTSWAVAKYRDPGYKMQIEWLTPGDRKESEEDCCGGDEDLAGEGPADEDPAVAEHGDLQSSEESVLVR